MLGNFIDWLQSILFINIYRSTLCLAGQDCGLCEYFTLNFDPASVRIFIEKGISTVFIAYYKLLLCGYLPRTTVSWPLHSYKLKYKIF